MPYNFVKIIYLPVRFLWQAIQRIFGAYFGISDIFSASHRAIARSPEDIYKGWSSFTL
jgi:hypothetical protein